VRHKSSLENNRGRNRKAAKITAATPESASKKRRRLEAAVIEAILAHRRRSRNFVVA
jgi:hypothetical protein